MRMTIAILALLAASQADAQSAPVAPSEGTLYCENLAEIDAQREAENQGFDRIYAAISTMTTASFCGDAELSDKVDERIRTALWALDDRATALSPAETLQLKQVKASYVVGRQMIDRRN
ncbi:hypothetical protein H0I76_01155 [Limibaculum sp. M0105]|uniref:Uncharacterized protein n=1 Tax=Thermohalobaculum xanthum TaxID=2753746 RepID=A0A8J7SA55_9RHOB|nr:hypothetical protein [Thermohalobaculum xanthum]MBK0397783.1 hypothetical protein [Thermohalobaculum xanthum]